MPMSPPPFARIRSLLSCRAWVCTCTAQSKLLRAAFQSLESALGRAGLSTSHVKGLSGDAWNDLVDLLAKQKIVDLPIKTDDFP